MTMSRRKTIHSTESTPLALAGVLLPVFVLGLMLTRIFPFLPSVNRLVGLALIAVYSLHFMANRPEIPPEILLYGGYILWGVVSGVIVAPDRGAVVSMVRTLVQLWGLVWAVAGLSAVQRDARVSFLSLAVGAVVLVGYGFASGDFSVAMNLRVRLQPRIFLLNPNTAAYYAFLGVAGLLYFWKRVSHILLRSCMLGCMAALSLGIVYSGSRKAFLGLLAFVLLWLWFCYRREASGRLRSAWLVALVLTGAYLLTNYALTETRLGRRLDEAREVGGLNETRTGMYRAGWDLFIKNPIAGVGLANFSTVTEYGAYSHSDYIEVLSTTGLLGALFYFPIYLILWKRLVRLQTNAYISAEARYHAGLFKVFVITNLLLAIGRINSQSVPAWVALASIIGYTHVLEKSGPVRPSTLKNNGLAL
jgi:O-antigen ligase